MEEAEPFVYEGGESPVGEPRYSLRKMTGKRLLPFKGKVFILFCSFSSSFFLGAQVEINWGEESSILRQRLELPGRTYVNVEELFWK